MPWALFLPLFLASSMLPAQNRTERQDVALDAAVRTQVIDGALKALNEPARNDFSRNVRRSSAPGAYGRTFDLSPWRGQTVRLRLATADNQGPLRAGVDDVRFERLAK